MSERQAAHLQDDELLALLDGEPAAREGTESRSHMEACPTCRTRLEELKVTIGEYARYRDVSRTLFPPPAAWPDLEPAFERIDHAAARKRFTPRPVYWLAAAAAVLAVLLVRRFESVPAVSAAELLRKASAVERVPPPQRRIRIKTRRRQFVRPALLTQTVHDGDRDLQQMFERAHFSWEEPLSARSFAAWREQLPEKSDAVPAADNFVYSIRTSTSAGELRQATLVLRIGDLQPMRETLEFTSDTVEITAAPDAATAPVGAAPATPSLSPEPPRTAEILPPVRRELQVFAALHSIGADLGEPVEMAPDGSRLLVTGTGLTGQRKQQLRASLEGIPGVEIRFEDATPSPRGGSTPADRTTSATAPVQQRLQTLLGSRESVEDFIDRALDASDAVMARAHALRALARAFPPAQEASLTAGDRELLTSLRRDHSTALEARLRELRIVLQPVLQPGPTPPAVPGAAAVWQDAAQTMFAAAQSLDQLLNGALAGSNAAAQDSDFQRITAALPRAEQAASAIR